MAHVRDMHKEKNLTALYGIVTIDREAELTDPQVLQPERYYRDSSIVVWLGAHVQDGA